MTNIPPSWQADQPPSPPPAQPQTETGQRMVRVKMPALRPTVTYAILGLTVFVYLLQLATNAGYLQGPFIALGNLIFGTASFQQYLGQTGGNGMLILLGGKISPYIMQGQFWRLITPVLLHDDSLPYGLLHIGFNMYFVYSLGPTLENFYGHKRFLALYFLGGLGGNVLSFVMSPGPTPSIGASTAVFGMVTAWAIFAYQNRAVFGQRARATLNNAIFIILINLAFGFSTSSVDNMGHLGGLITGLVFGWFAGPRLEVTYDYPEYGLVDQRSTASAWLVGMVIFIVLAGIVVLRISQG